MSQLYVVVLAVIVVVLLTVAIYRTFQVKTKADYLVADGLSPPGSRAHAPNFMDRRGFAFCRRGECYKNGFAALWQPAGGWLGLLLIYFIAPRARKFAQFTLPDLLEAGITRQRACWAPSRSCSLMWALPATSSREGKCPSSHLPGHGHSRIGHLPYCCVRHCHYGAGRHVLCGLHGRGHRLSGNGDLHHRHALSLPQGWRLGWLHAALPPSHFQCWATSLLPARLSSWCDSAAYAR